MTTKSFICRSESIQSGGTGIKFDVDDNGMILPAFVIRYKGVANAFLNVCAHMELELDYDNSEFFDISGKYLICANHGALFEPGTGLCIAGPCYGASLEQLQVDETNGCVFLDDERYSVVSD